MDKKHFRRCIKINFIMGLKERLQAATSEKGVNALLEEGKGYKDASEAIKRRWKKVAEESLRRMNKEKNNAKKKEKR